MKKTLILTLAGLLVSFSASATLIAYEGFDYADGSNLQTFTSDGGSGWADSGWTRAAGGSQFVTAVSSLSFNTLLTSGNSISGTHSGYNRNMTTNPLSGIGDGESVWMSFVLNVSTLGAASFSDTRAFYIGWNGAGGNATNAGSMTKAEIRDYDVGAGTYTIYAADRNNVASDGGVTLSLNQDYLISLRYVNNFSGANDLLEIYSIAASDLGLADPTGASATSSIGGYNMNRSDFTQVGFSAFNDLTANVALDEFRVGQSFSDVTPIPEPGACALFIGVAALVWSRRRRLCN
ncbi:hypothetical protein [Rubellicoccus peritrichatus]|uniref:PEP-CTERM protein-sorting domain-containing protein n=1 Tax=Rubellicoccus peritrichatus TaxID=3080537 RepID=A0AAQ3LDE9_9BACT|nr:hypothetical protein [Puniceicoccus sp. CR14]WOO43436.1 hypothetical protein RZN69_10075 [Puniceicoccus sp. CR14]